MEKEQQSYKDSFLKPSVEKIIIFTIISTFVPLYVYTMLCGGFQPIFIFMFDSIVVSKEANLFLVWLFSIPSLIFNYILAGLAFKTMKLINKEEKKIINWFMIAVIFILAILIFYLSQDAQGVFC